MYFEQPSRKELVSLCEDAPLLSRLMQTAMMESLLMRMSRLMDPPKSMGKSNVSLAQLTCVDPGFGPAASGVSKAWDASALKDVRNKYLSHNDLARSLNEAHTLSIPLSSHDVEALRGLAAALRDFRRVGSQKLSGTTYLDESLDRQMKHEIDVLARTMVAGDRFFRLLPEHAFLQEELALIEADALRQTNPEA